MVEGMKGINNISVKCIADIYYDFPSFVDMLSNSVSSYSSIVGSHQILNLPFLDNPEHNTQL